MRKEVHNSKDRMTLLIAAAALIQLGAVGQVTITKTGGIETGMNASGIALSPDESKLYVSFWEDAYSSPVQVRSLPGLGLLQTVTYGGYHTHGDVVVSADGCRIFTQNYYYDSLSQVNFCTGTVRTDLSTWQSWPGDIDITPDKNTVVVTVGRDGRDYDMNNDGLAFYNIAGGGFSGRGFVSLPDEPVGKKLGFSADGQYVYVPTRPRKSSLPRLYEVSVSSQQVTRWIEFNSSSLFGVACAGNRVFVGDYANAKVWVVDRGSWTKRSYSVPASPGTLAMHPDDKHLFVLFPQAASLSAIDTRTMEIAGSYAGLQINPSDIEFGAGGTNMYVAHHQPGAVFVFDVRTKVGTNVGCWNNGTGSLQYALNDNVLIWDLSGSYAATWEGLELSYALTHGTGGRIRGTGTAAASIGADTIDLSFNVNGVVCQKNGAPNIMLAFKGRGLAVLNGRSAHFTFTERINAAVDPAGKQITGTAKVIVSADGRSQSETIPFTAALPTGMDGSAVLSLECIPNGKKLAGTAEMTLSNGKKYGFSVRGQYNARFNESNLTLIPTGAKGCSMNLTVDGSTGRIKKLRGRALGQKISSSDLDPDAASGSR